MDKKNWLEICQNFDSKFIQSNVRGEKEKDMGSKKNMDLSRVEKNINSAYFMQDDKINVYNIL